MHLFDVTIAHPTVQNVDLARRGQPGTADRRYSGSVLSAPLSVIIRLFYRKNWGSMQQVAPNLHSAVYYIMLTFGAVNYLNTHTHTVHRTYLNTHTVHRT